MISTVITCNLLSNTDNAIDPWFMVFGNDNNNFHLNQTNTNGYLSDIWVELFNGFGHRQTENALISYSVKQYIHRRMWRISPSSVFVFRP